MEAACSLFLSFSCNCLLDAEIAVDADSASAAMVDDRRRALSVDASMDAKSAPFRKATFWCCTSGADLFTCPSCLRSPLSESSVEEVVAVAVAAETGPEEGGDSAFRADKAASSAFLCLANIAVSIFFCSMTISVMVYRYLRGSKKVRSGQVTYELESAI